MAAPRVLIVQPQEGARWRSITAYADSLRVMLEAGGFEVSTAEAPWFNPPSVVAGLRNRWTAQENVQRAARGEFEVVHLTDHALGHHISRFAKNAAVVVTCHDVMPFTTPGYYAGALEANVKRAFLRRSISALKHADAVVAVSNFTAGEADSFAAVPRDRTLIVPNIVRPGFAPIPREEAEARLASAGVRLPGGPRVLSVGNDRAYKNLPSLLQAIAQPALAAASLVRNGPLTSAHRAEAERLGLAGRLTEVSGLDDALLACLYASCDVLAQPSLAEGFGIPVIEAMACGLPVVTSDGGALPEVGAGAALVVPLAGDSFPLRLAESIARAMEEREALASSGVERAREFAPERVLPALVAAYDAALARRVARN